MRHPDETLVDEKKSGTIMTFYWTFDPDNADPGWDEWTKGDYPQDPVHLNGTDITMPRNMAEKFNLEGSGWYTEDGGHWVVNIVEPHALPENTLFKEVPFVDYGLDAPHFHFGLVPFRTVAGVHDDIPAGTWVYIPMFKDIEVNVYDIEDRTQIDYTFWHDGWFRVTDISWSFADDATQIDIFTGTVQAAAEVYGQIWDNFEKKGFWNETKQEYQELDSYMGEVSFFYRADVPVYSTLNAEATYRYAVTTDTVHNDTRPQEYFFAKDLGETIRYYPADLDSDGLRDDAVIHFTESNVLKGFLNGITTAVTAETVPLWELSLGSKVVNDIAIGDFGNVGIEGLLCATNEGIFANSNPEIESAFIKVSDEIAQMIAIADIENDDENELVIYNGNSFKSGEFAETAYSTFSTIAGVTTESVTALATGDITAEGQDELIYGTASGIYSHDFSGVKSGLIADDISSPDDLAMAYVDPDGFADIYAVHGGEVKVKYSSHKVGAPFVILGKTDADWITLASINPKDVKKESKVATTSPTKQRSVTSSFSMKDNALTLPFNSSAGALSIFSLNGRKLAEIPAVRSGDELTYSLNGLRHLGNVPLVFSVETGSSRISRMMLLK